MNTIEEAAFALVEKFAASELEKLAKYLELLVFGKKSIEAKGNSEPAAESPPASRAKAKGAKASTETTPDPSDTGDEPF